MCICVNCYCIDRCTIYHALELKHEQLNLTAHPTFEAIKPIINLNIRPKNNYTEMELDVIGRESFQKEAGKWL